MTGRNVRRKEVQTEQAVMNHARVTQPEEGTDLKGAYSIQALVNITNVPSPTRNGGGNKKNVTLLPQPKVTAILPGGRETAVAVQAAIGEILEGNAFETADGNGAAQSNVKVIVSQEQYSQYRTEKELKRKKAPKGKTQEQSDDALTGIAMRSTRPLP